LKTNDSFGRGTRGLDSGNSFDRKILLSIIPIGIYEIVYKRNARGTN